MGSWFNDNPGRIYIVATLLPLAACTLMLLGGLARTLARPYRREKPLASFFYYLFGGDKPLKAGAYFATGTIALAAVLAIVGLVQFLGETEADPAKAARWAERRVWAEIGRADTERASDAKSDGVHDHEKELAEAELRSRGVKLELGYRIDHLTAILFAMVTFISTWIFVFSLGYMKEETDETVTDHEVEVKAASGDGGHHHGEHVATAAQNHGHGHHLKRRGRYGRFFAYLSLFCFSMLNLLIADNLFQVFVSWELVGVCSFFLIGFYYERNSASTAANKAFIVNRVGDAGFLVGMAIVWVYFGTFNFQDINAKMRCPASDYHENAAPYDKMGKIVRADRGEGQNARHQIVQGLLISPEGKEVLIFGPVWHSGQLQRDFATDPYYTTIPYYLLVIAGIGIFLGCVGKSAQFPLHTWLPDAMEGPTPVSALIHAATMVAAGVYLVGRAYPIFTPEVLMVIAYVGAITLFLAATIALVQTDIKRVLAYSTVSQLGYMMLSLGVGGWTPGLLHLLTHAFFKALLFLASGAVIFGLHHQQDLRKMGGLLKKMPITALTMLVGVLAIVGTPFFSGWYSKDQIIGQAIGYGLTNQKHMLLAILPLISATMTAFYMFRLWFLAFTGPPRDAQTYEHAHESPWIMTVPLIVLALFSFGVAWGPEFWNAENSLAGHALQKAQPAAVSAFEHEHHAAEEHHVLAGVLALGAAAMGVAVAVWIYGLRKIDPERLRQRFPFVHQFLLMKWYFDELYDALFVRPTVKLAFLIGRFDKRTAKPEEAEAADRRIDPSSVDGVLSALGLLCCALGQRMRAFQSGLIRRYVLVLVLTTVVMYAILSILAY